MIVDRSALVCILRKEPETIQMVEALASSASTSLSAGTWIELGAVTSDDPRLRAELALLMSTYSIAIAPVSVDQARIGHDAYRQFGKGHHRAKLNFGDCFAYAPSKTTGEPLLFKGIDFTRTDIRAAV